jgi:Flp pilus assembly protein TadG
MSALNAKKQKGQVIIMLAISMVILVGAVGIAIDSGLGYMVKARLNATVDSAAAAAARAASRSSDQALQEASARQAAQRFFAANYPEGYLDSTTTLNEPVVRFDEGSVMIDISAQAVLPVTFMRVMGFKQLNVNATSRSARKDLRLGNGKQESKQDDENRHRHSKTAERLG